MTGCLRLATNPDRWTEFRRLATTARSFGMEMHLISPEEVEAHVAADGGVRSRRRQLAADRRAASPPTSPSPSPRVPPACMGRVSWKKYG